MGTYHAVYICDGNRPPSIRIFVNIKLGKNEQVGMNQSMATKSWVDKVEKYFWGLEMYELRLKHKTLKKNREIERAKNPQNTTTVEIIQHFSHSHPLSFTEPDYHSFKCNTCETRGEGKRYHCAPCEFDLHLTCASINNITSLVHHMPLEEMHAYGVDVGREMTISNSFVHPAHDLVTEYKRQSFKCGHCNDLGDGLRFCCNVCSDVEFHLVCAENPTRKRSYLFPNHELELKLSPPLPCFAKCDLCGDVGPNDSLMYRCKEYKLHARCTQWPLYLAHPLHPPHTLVLKPTNLGRIICSACGELIGRYNKYKYNCKPCGLDFHLSCILRHSKLGMGQELNPARSMTLLPVTNLILPNTDWKKPHPSNELRWGIINSTLNLSGQIIDGNN